MSISQHPISTKYVSVKKIKTKTAGHLAANLKMEYKYGKHSFRCVRGCYVCGCINMRYHVLVRVIKTNKFGVRQERQLDLFYETGTGSSCVHAWPRCPYIKRVYECAGQE